MPISYRPTFTQKSLKPQTMQRGFSLVELMVVLAIVAVLMAIALPDFVRVTRGLQLAHQSREMAGAIKLTRAEAIRRGQTVVMCRANAALTQCVTTGTPTWETGWLIFNDETPVGAAQANNQYDGASNASEVLIAIKQPMAAGISAMAASTIGNRISFNPAGESSGNLGNVQSITFSHALAPDTSNERYLVINRTGRVTLSSWADCQAGAVC